MRIAAPDRKEQIITGTSEARRRFSELVERASKGIPVTIAAGGKRVVTLISRDMWISLLERLDAAEETAAMLSEPDTLRKLLQSHEDAKSGRGITIEEAERLLGHED